MAQSNFRPSVLLSLVFFFLICVPHRAGAQSPPLIWQHCYGGDSMDAFTCLKPAPDGGFIAVGMTRSADGDLAANAGIKGLWVVKLDAMGSVQWEKTYNDSITGANYIEPTFDGGYILTGAKTMKLDASGNVQWAADGFGGIVHRCTDSGFIINTDTYYPFNLIKLNATGGTVWQKNYGPEAGGQVTIADLCLAPDGSGFVITGTVTDIHPSPFIAKVDNSGTLLTTINPDGGHGSGGRVCATSDGNYVYEYMAPGLVSKIMKLGPALNNLWTNTVVVDPPGFLAPTSDGGFIVWANSYDMTLTKYDGAGSRQWAKSIAGTRQGGCYSAFQTAGGNYAVAGLVAANDSDVSGLHGGDDAWVALLGANTGVPADKAPEFSIYPVPATNTLNVDMPESYAAATIRLTDISGNIVIIDNSHGTHRSLDVSCLAAGEYLLTIVGNGVTSSYKVIHW